MAERHRNKAAYAASIMFASFVTTFFVWLFWPYPVITTEGEATITNLPADGIYKTGDVVRWTKPYVCQPSGRSTAEIWAVRVPGANEPQVILKTLLVHREFDVSDKNKKCTENNPTSVYVFGNLPSGTYDFEVRACMYNPTPQPNCSVFPGPSDVKIQRVVGNEPSIKP